MLACHISAIFKYGSLYLSFMIKLELLKITELSLRSRSNYMRWLMGVKLCCLLASNGSDKLTDILSKAVGQEIKCIRLLGSERKWAWKQKKTSSDSFFNNPCYVYQTCIIAAVHCGKVGISQQASLRLWKSIITACSNWTYSSRLQFTTA